MGNHRRVNVIETWYKPKPPKIPSTPIFRFSMVGAHFQASLEAASGLELVSQLSIFDPKYEKSAPARPISL
jgi:hypothetical protein